MNKIPRALVLNLFLLTVSATGLSANTIELTATANAELRAGTPDLAVSGDTIVAGGLGDNSGNETRRGLLRFDLSSIPSGAVIRDVQLKLQVVRVPQSAANSTFEIRRLLSDWEEASASWNSRLAGVTWQVPGALGAQDAVAQPSSTADVTGLGTVVFELTGQLIADVQQWLVNSNSNHGWVLRSQSEDLLRTARHFASRQALDTQTRPALVITFDVPPSISNVSASGGAIHFEFSAQSGRNYFLESREFFCSGDWETVRALDGVDTDQPVTVDEPIVPNSGARYFRLRAE